MATDRFPPRPPVSETSRAPAISAVICTHNRVGHALKAVGSLLAQTLPPDRFEILLVDNGSTDGTGATVQAAAAGAPNFHYVFEPVLGLSRARNTGWRRAAAPLVAYLDDDAIANPDWLAELLGAFDRPLRPGTVGGKAVGNWEVPRPAWLHDVLLGCLTVIDWGDQPFTVAPPHYVVGANIAFRRDLLERAGGFAENLGRKGGLLLSAEEREMTQRIEAMGHPTLYWPAASVRHWVGKERLTRAWFLDRAYWQGVSEAVAELNAGPLTPQQRAARARRGLRRPQVLKNRVLALPDALPEVLSGALSGANPHPRVFLARFDLVRAAAYAATMRHGAAPDPRAHAAA